MLIEKRLLFPAITLFAFLGGATLSSAQTAAPAASPSPAMVDAKPSPSPAAKKTSKKKKKAEPATTDTATPATGTASPATDTSKPLATQAPGGGPGMVWVNQKSKVYHKEDSRYYGRTKDGKYMTEDEAKAMGAHPAGAGGKKKTDKKS